MKEANINTQAQKRPTAVIGGKKVIVANNSEVKASMDFTMKKYAKTIRDLKDK